MRCRQGRMIPIEDCSRMTLGYSLSGALIGHCRCERVQVNLKVNWSERPLECGVVEDCIRVFETNVWFSLSHDL
ncbi:hypothetical protein TNCV_4171101 [Trichonephila clavipes]|nr:hypothetical protein TNCV_4171101 [Trichonephila clavipes]